LDILLRRRSFLEHPDWLSVPWVEEGHKDLVDYAVDILVHVPGLIEKFDRIPAGTDAQRMLQADAEGLARDLYAWRQYRIDEYCLTRYNSTPTFGSLVQRVADGTVVDNFLARALTLHLSTWLLFTRVGQSALLPCAEDDIVDTILSICEEYSCRQQGHGVMPWTFAIRVALFTSLSGPSTPRGRDLCARLEDRFSTNMLSDIIASLPGLHTKMSFCTGSNSVQ
jgi:hypothetical protein